MRNLLTTSLLAGTLLFGGASVAGAAQVSFGIRIGPPPHVRVEHRPARPGRDYMWVPGYWYPEQNRYAWHAGYWTRPPYEGAHWVSPHRADGMFYEGYWDGPHGRVDHNHSWDHDRGRDYDHSSDHRDNDHHDNDHHDYH